MPTPSKPSKTIRKRRPRRKKAPPTTNQKEAERGKAVARKEAATAKDPTISKKVINRT